MAGNCPSVLNAELANCSSNDFFSDSPHFLCLLERGVLQGELVAESLWIAFALYWGGTQLPYDHWSSSLPLFGLSKM